MQKTVSLRVWISRLFEDTDNVLDFNVGLKCSNEFSYNTSSEQQI
jgi:hypothetical protein